MKIALKEYGKHVEFPEGTTYEEMAEVLRANFPPVRDIVNADGSWKIDVTALPQMPTREAYETAVLEHPENSKYRGVTGEWEGAEQADESKLTFDQRPWIPINGQRYDPELGEPYDPTLDDRPWDVRWRDVFDKLKNAKFERARFEEIPNKTYWEAVKGGVGNTAKSLVELPFAQVQSALNIYDQLVYKPLGAIVRDIAEGETEYEARERIRKEKARILPRGDLVARAADSPSAKEEGSRASVLGVPASYRQAQEFSGKIHYETVEPNFGENFRQLILDTIEFYKELAQNPLKVAYERPLDWAQAFSTAKKIRSNFKKYVRSPHEVSGTAAPKD